VDGQISDFKPYEPHAPASGHGHLRPVDSVTTGA